MPQRTRYEVRVVDPSPLARNMYQILFSGQEHFRVTFSDDFASLAKQSVRFRPDLLLVNGNLLKEKVPPAGPAPKFPCSTIALVSRGEMDLKEAFSEIRDLSLLEKPFYPYDLLSLANRLIHDRQETPRRGRPSRGDSPRGRPSRRRKRGR